MKLRQIIPTRDTMKNGKTKVIVGASTIGALAAAALAWQQIGDVFTLKEEHDLIHAAQSVKDQIQFIDVQIVQAEVQLEIIEQREKTNTVRDGDATRKARLLDQIKRLEAARENLLKK